MTEYRGIIHNGVIKPFEPMDFPEGTEVAFHEVGNGAGTMRTWPQGANWAGADERVRSGYSIEQLAKEQGVQPVASLDELSGDWPESDEIEEFLRSVREWRR